MDELAFWIRAADTEELGKPSKPAGMCELECQGEIHVKEPWASPTAWSPLTASYSLFPSVLRINQIVTCENDEILGSKFYLCLESLSLPANAQSPRIGLESTILLSGVFRFSIITILIHTCLLCLMFM